MIEIHGGSTGASIVDGWPAAWDQSTLVPVSTLDRVLGWRFEGQRCLMIVDIEGAEGLMLGGASEWLSRTPRPIWMLEIWVSGPTMGPGVNPDLQSTFQMFWSRGYEAWTVEQSPRLVPPEEVDTIVATGEDTLGTHGFLFLEEGTGRTALGG